MDTKNLKITMSEYMFNHFHYKIESDLLNGLNSITEEAKETILPMEANFSLELQYSIKKDLTQFIIEVDSVAQEDVVIEQLKAKFPDVKLPQVEGNFTIRSLMLNMKFKFNMDGDFEIADNAQNFRNIIEELNEKVQSLVTHIVVDKIRQLTSTDYKGPIDITTPEITISLSHVLN